MNKKRLLLTIIVVILLVMFIGFINYKLDDVESNIINGTILNQESNSIANEDEQNQSKDDYFILYKGKELKIKTGYQNVYDNMIDLKPEESNKKYNTIYYNYEKGKYIGETQGKFEYEDGYVEATNVSTIAISKKYDAIPRIQTKLDQIPEQLNDMMDYPFLEIEKIDLDGNGTEEYIVCTNVNYEKGEIGDGEPVASSDIMLFDSNFNKIANLVTIEDGFVSPEKDEKVFLSLDKVIYVDIDNDGIMEILIDVPSYEEMELDVFKYNNGKIEGETQVRDRILP